MATKRFTDTEKWKDPFFENLSNDLKLVWLYLLDDCDNAGIWSVSIRRINYHCNTQLTKEEVLNIFGSRIYIVSEERWFFLKFVTFQYGTDWLAKKSKPILSVVSKLEEIGVIKDNNLVLPSVSKQLGNSMETLSNEDTNTIQESSKEYVTKFDTTKDKDKVKGREQYRDKSLDKDTDIEEDMGKEFDLIFNN